MSVFLYDAENGAVPHNGDVDGADEETKPDVDSLQASGD